MQIILLADGLNFWSSNYYTEKNQVAVSWVYEMTSCLPEKWEEKLLVHM